MRTISQENDHSLNVRYLSVLVLCCTLFLTSTVAFVITPSEARWTTRVVQNSVLMLNHQGQGDSGGEHSQFNNTNVTSLHLWKEVENTVGSITLMSHLCTSGSGHAKEEDQRI